MARLLGGPFSRAAGKAAGLVFSSARAGLKKQQTIREHVIPTNPRTNLQVSQRNRFQFASQIARAIGRSIYQFDFNRSVRQLAGFPSLVNIFTLPMDRNGGTLSEPRSVSLGVRHFPESFTASVSDGDVTVSWSEELGAIGNDDDEAVVILVATEPFADSYERSVIVNTEATRDDGEITISDGLLPETSAGDYVIGLYFRNQGINIPSRDRRTAVRWVGLA